MKGLRWVILALTLIAVAAGGALAGRTAKHLDAGGYISDESESARADKLLTGLGGGSPHLIFVMRAAQPVDSGATAAEGIRLAAQWRNTEGVVYVQSTWDTADPSLVAPDRLSTAARLRLAGTDRQISELADRLIARYKGQDGPFTIAATGLLAVQRFSEQQVDREMHRAEWIGIPLVLLVLLFALRTVVAALAALIVAAVPIACGPALLGLLATITPVSIFALNLTTTLGFGMSVNYGLIVLSRFREHRATGLPVEEAVMQTLRTAGRTVMFSVAVLVLTLSSLMLFPVDFYRSLAFGAILGVVLAGIGALVVLPALLMTMGGHLDRAALPGRLGKPRTGRLWARVATFAIARKWVTAGSTLAALVIVGMPFLGLKFGFPDHRWLPAPAAPRVTAETLARDIPLAAAATPLIALPGAAPDSPQAQLFARQLSEKPGVAWVDVPGGAYTAGVFTGHDAPATPASGTWLTVHTTFAATSRQAQDLVRSLRSSAGPGPVLVAGPTAMILDMNSELRSRLLPAFAVVVLAATVLLLVFTRSIILPLKALAMNLLSLTASFGAMIYLFQDGHLAGLHGASATGEIPTQLPMVLFCIAYGISMDYELILLSRVQDFYRQTGDNNTAIVKGLGHTGGLFSASALAVIAAIGSLMASSLTMTKLFGVTLALAVLIDATLIRCLLVPAVMAIAGRWNWWPAARDSLHDSQPFA